MCQEIKINSQPLEESKIEPQLPQTQEAIREELPVERISDQVADKAHPLAPQNKLVIQGNEEEQKRPRNSGSVPASVSAEQRDVGP